jgi:hypothetical protein
VQLQTKEYPVASRSQGFDQAISDCIVQFHPDLEPVAGSIEPVYQSQS